jgi:DNA-binding transcriptional MerR regulator
MTASPTASHLSIGEVLEQLRRDFPDVTISKIRFLESQGLIDPERTPSGYRKFYESDLERLRWILQQQKDHFLPLKVIKERLELGELDGGAPADTAPAPEPAGNAGGAAKRRKRKRKAGGTTLPTLDDDAEEPVPGRAASSGGVSLTRAELAKAAEVDDAQLADLEAYGLLVPASRSGERVLFDEEGLAVARAAAGFAKHGVEARHLRMYKHFAQRETDLFEQVLLPYLRQRNPEARARAQADLAEMARLGRALRAALLVVAVRKTLTE